MSSPIGSSVNRNLSKIEQYRLKKQESEEAGAGVSSFLGRFGQNEKSGLGRIAMVAPAPSTDVSNIQLPYQQNHHQPQQHLGGFAPPPQQLRAPPVLPLASNNNGARNSPPNPAAGGVTKAVTTLEARELQQQLDGIRAMRDLEASMSNSYSNNPPRSAPSAELAAMSVAVGGFTETSSFTPPPPHFAHQQHQQQLLAPIVGRGNQQDKVECACCGKLVPKAVVAYVPKDTVQIRRNNQAQQPQQQRPGPAQPQQPQQQQPQQQVQQRRVGGPSAAARRKSSQQPVSRAEEVRGRWRM